MLPRDGSHCVNTKVPESETHLAIPIERSSSGRSSEVNQCKEALVGHHPAEKDETRDGATTVPEEETVGTRKKDGVQAMQDVPDSSSNILKRHLFHLCHNLMTSGFRTPTIRLHWGGLVCICWTTSMAIT